MVVVMAVVDGRGLKSPAFGVDGDGRTIGLLVLLFLMLLCTPDREIGSVASLLESSEPLPKRKHATCGLLSTLDQTPCQQWRPKKLRKRVPSPPRDRLLILNSGSNQRARDFTRETVKDNITSKAPRYTPQSPTAAKGSECPY